MNKYLTNSKYNSVVITLAILGLISYLAPTRNEQIKITYSYPATAALPCKSDIAGIVKTFFGDETAAT